MNDLKRCPFCGGEAKWFYCCTSQRPYIQLAKIQCEICGSGTRVFATEDRYGNKTGGEYEAEKLWNRRVKGDNEE